LGKGDLLSAKQTFIFSGMGGKKAREPRKREGKKLWGGVGRENASTDFKDGGRCTKPAVHEE